jgi:chloramphenicol-sensitive protein RarD
VTAITPAKSIVTVDGERTRNGVIAALFAYCVWGFFPILFHMLDAAGSELIVAHRIVWSLLLVGAILWFSGRWDEVRAVLRDGVTLRRLIVSALLVACNWLVYVWAVGHNMLLETSFGYFLNPLVNVAIGMVMLGERQNRWQWVAIIIAAIAMAIQAIGVGGVPWVALSLAVSFALYGYFRKTVNAGSATGLFVETLVLSPFALGYVAYTFVVSGPGPHADPKLLFLLILTGPATSLSLLLFAYAVQRLRLTTIGMFQYIAPSIQFVLAIALFGEHLNVTRLISFGLIWLSLIVFSAASFRRRSEAAIPV